MEMRECKLILGNLSLVEKLSGREKAGKLECSKKMKKWLSFKGVCVLLLKEPIESMRRPASDGSVSFRYRISCVAQNLKIALNNSLIALIP